MEGVRRAQRSAPPESDKGAIKLQLQRGREDGGAACVENVHRCQGKKGSVNLRAGCGMAELGSAETKCGEGEGD